MVKDSARKCSHCGNNGHNSRTCCNGKGGCLKLFGVTIVAEKEEESLRKSKSTGDLAACNGENSAVDAGYLSDGLIHYRRSHDRRKGVPWTEDEHRSFLTGLEKLGKGDWRGISKNYVPSRTPTQVASHAQKYFIRIASGDNKKKRRSSLFDMSFKGAGVHPSPPPQESGDKTVSEIPPQADNPAAANLNKFGPTQTQTMSTSAQVASPSEAPPVLPLAASYGIPNLRQISYMPMVGGSGNGLNFPGANVMPTVSFVPVMNFPNHGGYFYMPKTYGNCAPYSSQSASGLMPQPLLRDPLKLALNSSG